MQNLKLIRIKKPPASHSQEISLQLSKILIRENNSRSILQMLDSKG